MDAAILTINALQERIRAKAWYLKVLNRSSAGGMGARTAKLFHMGKLSEECTVKLNEIVFTWEVRSSPKGRLIWFVSALHKMHVYLLPLNGHVSKIMSLHLSECLTLTVLKMHHDIEKNIWHILQKTCSTLCHCNTETTHINYVSVIQSSSKILSCRSKNASPPLR